MKPSFTTVIFVQLTLSLLPYNVEAEDKLSCGPRALAIAGLIAKQDAMNRDELVKAFDKPDSLHTIAELRRAAERLGYAARYVKYEPLNPQLPAYPIIIPLTRQANDDHFVVLYGRDDTSVYVVDYPRNPVRRQLADLAVKWKWNGDGLEIRDSKYSTFGFWLPEYLNGVNLTLSIACTLGLAAILLLRRKV